jgi:uncharacterized phiE125 gp8 family phage protein
MCVWSHKAGRLYLDQWPQKGTLDLRFHPLQSVDAIRVYDGEGGNAILPATEYLVDTSSRPARIVMRNGQPLPGQAINGIEVDLTAGFGDTSLDVPQQLRQATMQLASHWYDNRGLGFEPLGAGEPNGFAALVQPFREVRL